MTTPNLSDDEVLLTLLTGLIDETDPVPEAAVLAAKAVARLDSVDAELAALVADSLDNEVMMFRREVSDDRQMSFASSRFNLDIEVPSTSGTLFGAISPPESVEVEIETTSGTSTTCSDALGRFHVEVSRGPCRLRVGARDADGTIVTPWITR